MNATAKRIKQLMNERSWSEYRLAEKSGLSQSTLSNIFNRNTVPGIPTLELICKAFGITLAQFFAEDENFFPLTLEEQNLIKQWAHLTQQQKTTVFSVIKTFTF